MPRMAERSDSHIWLMRLVYLGLCLSVVFLHLLPLDTSLPSPLDGGRLIDWTWLSPDLILALTCAWVLRRPEFVPPLSVAIVFLTADLLYQMPPGLWAAFVLLGSETLRSRAPGLRDLTFPVEWFTVAVTLLVMTLGQQIVLALLLVDRPALGPSILRLVMTLVSYPIVVYISQIVFGVRKQMPGDVDALVNRK